MAINSIGQIHMTVTDIDSAVEFYRDILGLTFLFDVPTQQMAFFDVDGVRLYLGKAESPEFTSNPLLYLSVDDVHDEYTRLLAAGVEFVDAPHVVHSDGSAELWMAFFHNPDHHPMAIMQERPLSVG
jgi:predicted enzyme related to lactoylglutathione lyase